MPTHDRSTGSSSTRPTRSRSSYWSYDRETRTLHLARARRPAGYVVALRTLAGLRRSRACSSSCRWSTRSARGSRRGARPAIRASPASPDGCSSTGTTPSNARTRRFFFCQLEAIETLIWLAEAPPAERVGIEFPATAGRSRGCAAKMATGSGKTIVMAMLIAWQVLNKVTYPQDPRYSKNVFVVARPHGQEPPAGARARRPRQLLRRVQHRARRRCWTSCARAR